MRAQLRAELLKQRSIPTAAGLLATMIGLVLFAVLLHGFGLPAEIADTSSEQLTMVIGWGAKLGALFAALLGAIAVTAEVRYGTIRPTFLVSPDRGRVVAAKLWASTLIGGGFGLTACATAAAVGTAVLGARGIDLQLGAADYGLFLAGGVAAAALWGGIGVGVGAIVRNQVPAMVGLCAWLLFVEGLLVGNVASFGEVGRYAPGAAGAAISGIDPETLLSPGAGLVLLGLYASTAAMAGVFATARRDVV